MVEDNEARVREILQDVRTIAVIGAHPDASKAASYVPAYLLAQGYRILPVNPRYAGQRLFGETTRATLAEFNERIDLVNIFRRPQDLPGHGDDLKTLSAPLVVWFQLGIRHDEFARELENEGFEVIQDRCTLADHRRFGIGRVFTPAS